MPESVRQAVIKANLGKKQSKETIAKRALALKGRKRPPEVCAKISATKRAKQQAREHMLEQIQRAKKENEMMEQGLNL